MTASKLSSKKLGYHHGDLREALVEAGLAILGEGGDPAALSLREASRRAGVSAMAPYRHFPDKEALLAAVAAVGFERLRAALLEADRDPDPFEALVAQGVAYVAQACADPAMFRLMFGTAMGGKHPVLATASDRAYGVMKHRVAGMVPPDDGDAWALHCWATAHGLAVLAVGGLLVHHGEAPTALADRVLRLTGKLPGREAAIVRAPKL